MRDSGSMEFLLRLLATMAGIWVSARLIPDISFTSGASLTETALTLAVIALVFTGVNSIIKPIVKTLTFPLYLLSFGLFAIVTNSVLFKFTGWLSTQLGSTGGFLSCLFGAIITAIVSSFVAGLFGAKKKED